jgi:hypothetical protein
MTLYNALIRSRMEHGAFLFNKLKEKQLQKLEKIRYRAVRGALGYRSSTLTNVMLAEAKEILIFCRFKQLVRNYVVVSLVGGGGRWALDPPGRDTTFQTSRADAVLYRWLG